MAAARSRTVRPRRGVARAGLAAVLAAALGLTGCTSPEPAPRPTPTPEASPEPAPSGVQVAVVLGPQGDGDPLSLLDVEGRLDDLAEARVGDVAGIRSVTVDDADFVPDTAALLADGGADLVCVLAEDGDRTVVDLADRYPASRFCAVGSRRETTPDNVDLFEVAHEQLGHVLGVATAALAGQAPVGVVLGGDAEERTRRRAGARAALAGSAVVVDAAVEDVEEAAELVATTDGERAPAVLLVDAASAAVAEVLAGSTSRWVGPGDLATEEPADVRWSVRVDALVGAAIDELVTPEDPEQPVRLGFGEQVFALSFADDVPSEVRDATEVAADELARGARDPLAVLPGPGRVAPEQPPALEPDA